MADIPEPAKKIQRLMMIMIIAGGLAALAYAGATWLSPNEETACSEGHDLARNNAPGKTPRVDCKLTSMEDAE